MLDLNAIACTKGDKRLFEGVSAHLQAGQALHVQGHNGVGKTSLLRMLAALSPCDEGEIRFQGEPIAKLGASYRAQLLYIGHQNGLNEQLTALENLKINTALAGFAASDAHIATCLAQLGLADLTHLAVKHFSQGQKHRAALAQLDLTQAPLWVLDEPLAALDDLAIAQLTKQLLSHLQAGGLLVFTSHQPLQLDPSLVQGLSLTVHRTVSTQNTREA